MKVLAYKSTGVFARLIRWFTRSEYNHVAIMLDDGAVIEALGVHGVTYSPPSAPFRRHKKGTVIDVFDIDVPRHQFNKQARQRVTAFLYEQLNKPYDWLGVTRFYTRIPDGISGRWFCSELVCAALREGGVELIQVASSHASPRDVAASVVLEHVDVREA